MDNVSLKQIYHRLFVKHHWMASQRGLEIEVLGNSRRHTQDIILAYDNFLDPDSPTRKSGRYIKIIEDENRNTGEILVSSELSVIETMDDIGHVPLVACFNVGSFVAGKSYEGGQNPHYYLESEELTLFREKFNLFFSTRGIDYKDVIKRSTLPKHYKETLSNLY